MRTLILAALAALAVILVTSPASARCMMSYCKDGAATTSTPTPSTSWAITNTSRQRLGDIYNPGHGRRLQIRDNSRRILFNIERDGTITDRHRRKVGTVERLMGD